MRGKKKVKHAKFFEKTITSYQLIAKVTRNLAKTDKEFADIY